MKDIYEYLDLLNAVRLEAEKLERGIQQHYALCPSNKVSVDIRFDDSIWYLDINYGEEILHSYHVEFDNVNDLRRHMSILMVAVNICAGKEV